MLKKEVEKKMFGKIGTIVGAHKTLAIIIAAVFMGSVVAGGFYIINSHSVSVHTITTQKVYSPSLEMSVQSIAIGGGSGVIGVNGINYTNNNIQNMFSQTINSTGNMNIPIPNMSNFTTGEYVEFQISLKNTGDTYFTFANNITMANITNYFVNSTGAFISGTSINGAVSGNTTENMTSFIQGSGNLSDYLTYLDNNTAWNTNWVNWWGNFSATPSIIGMGQTITFDMYIGLGSDVPPSLPGQYFGISLTLDAIAR